MKISDPPSRDEGERVFREILENCCAKPEPRIIERERQAIQSRMAQNLTELEQYVLDEREEKLWRWERAYVIYKSMSQHSLAFLLVLKPADCKNDTGHALALYRVGSGYHFFDPNFGEFDLPKAASGDSLAFLGQLWLYYRRWHRLVTWELLHVYYSPFGPLPFD